MRKDVLLGFFVFFCSALLAGAGLAEAVPVQAKQAEHRVMPGVHSISATVTPLPLADSACTASTCGTIRRNTTTNLLQVCMCR